MPTCLGEVLANGLHQNMCGTYSNNSSSSWSEVDCQACWTVDSLIRELYKKEDYIKNIHLYLRKSIIELEKNREFLGESLNNLIEESIKLLKYHDEISKDNTYAAVDLNSLRKEARLIEPRYFDCAIIYSYQGRAVYDYDLILDCYFSKEKDPDYERFSQWFEPKTKIDSEFDPIIVTTDQAFIDSLPVLSNSSYLFIDINGKKSVAINSLSQ